MRSFLFSVLLAISSVSGGAVSSATLGLSFGEPSLSSSTAFVDYLAFGPDGDLSTFGAEVDVSNGVSPTGFTEIGFGLGFSLADPTNDFSGGFDIFDDVGEFLAGDLFAVGFTEDVIELQFSNLSGSGANEFGSSVLAFVSFEDPLGENPFSSLFDGDSLGASISFASVIDTTVAPIPLPGGLPLLLAGIGAFTMVRKRT